LSKTSYSVGKGKRFSTTDKTYNQLPGPGNYDTINYNSGSSPKYAIGKGNRIDLTGTMKLPGPGQYNLGDGKNNIS